MRRVHIVLHPLVGCCIAVSSQCSLLQNASLWMPGIVQVPREGVGITTSLHSRANTWATQKEGAGTGPAECPSRPAPLSRPAPGDPTG